MRLFISVAASGKWRKSTVDKTSKLGIMFQQGTSVVFGSILGCFNISGVSYTMMIPPATSIKKDDKRHVSRISKHSFKQILYPHVPLTISQFFGEPPPPRAHLEERPPNGRGLQIWWKCLGGQICRHGEKGRCFFRGGNVMLV